MMQSIRLKHSPLLTATTSAPTGMDGILVQNLDETMFEI
jgi:hypothetical protein